MKFYEIVSEKEFQGSKFVIRKHSFPNKSYSLDKEVSFCGDIAYRNLRSTSEEGLPFLQELMQKNTFY